MIRVTLGAAYHFAGRNDQAIEQYEKAFELDPFFVPAHFDLGLAYVEKGMYNAAIAQFQEGTRILERVPLFLALQGGAYAAAARYGEARSILMQLQQVAKQKYVAPYFVARLYAALAEKQEALDWLEVGYRQRDAFMVLLKIDRRFDTLRSEPRF